MSTSPKELVLPKLAMLKKNIMLGALVVTSEYKDDDSCISDSGCSNHITSNSSFLSTYQKVDGRKVTMGTEASYPIVSIGDVRIIMFDDVVRILFRVFHVPSLNRHLTSLDTLDKGFRCIGKGGV